MKTKLEFGRRGSEAEDTERNPAAITDLGRVGKWSGRISKRWQRPKPDTQGKK
jgi:hypothetical protein